MSNVAAFVHVGFIGLGEAGRAIASGLAGQPGVAVYGYDASPEASREAASQLAGDLVVVDSLQDLADSAQVILSTVVAGAATEVASQIAPWIGEDHLYVDLNSVSPQSKQRIGEISGIAGADFVEGAVMTNVAAKGHRVPVYACGPGAARFAALAARLDMDVEDLGPELGSASATKMFRSILVKGLEALLLESLTAAERYGAGDRVLDKVAEGYPGLDWKALASELIGRTAVHGSRRAEEMREVAATLAAMGIAPHMAAASAERIAESAAVLHEAGYDGDTDDYKAIVSVVNARADRADPGS